MTEVTAGEWTADLGPFDDVGGVTWSVDVTDRFGNTVRRAGTPALTVACETGGFTTG
jgi:hypothetical protein